MRTVWPLRVDRGRPGQVEGSQPLRFLGRELDHPFLLEGGAQFDGRSVGHETPLHEHHDAMCEPFRLREVVRGEQDRRPPACESIERLPEELAALDVHADGRLVEEEDLWIAGQRHREPDALRLSARELRHLAPRDVSKPAEASNSSTAGPRLRWNARASSTTSRTVAPDGRPETCSIGPDGSSPNGFASVGPRDGHVPLRRALQADRAVDHRGLPGPIRPEESDDRSAGDLEIQPRDRVDLAIPNAETFDRDGRIASGVAHRGRRGCVPGHRAIMQPPVRRRTIARPCVATKSDGIRRGILQLGSRRVPLPESEASAPRRPT